MLKAAQINLREAGSAIKIQLQKFGKEISRDYQIKLPEDVLNISNQELHNWIMEVKDNILQAEEGLEKKSVLLILLNSYLFSLSQIEKSIEETDELSVSDLL